MGGKYTTASSEPPSGLSQQRWKGRNYHNKLPQQSVFHTNSLPHKYYKNEAHVSFSRPNLKVVSTLEHYQIEIKVVNIQIYYRRYSIFMIIDHDPCLALFALPKSNFGFNSIEGYCNIAG